VIETSGSSGNGEWGGKKRMHGFREIGITGDEGEKKKPPSSPLVECITTCAPREANVRDSDEKLAERG
jgi:hypothetical protein